ncbi:4-oxalocrotonate tautomerase family protein [Helicobacter pylori]|uniref:2-hydroxymuconate tautomerase family protein n=1 Tax=Helicobacter pylori TaxID=210 RepID=UPI00026A03CC|nr:4-oxalocrotonate tautomerase family protein [Helicobacter pylori]EJB59639.1 4-oxalocrotonate tautomerase [Helicobacter pylori Hp H-36]EMR56988.1 4-oxalocrotonate tautomerase enzyme family protein [Helicobacter pylori CCHI 33]KAA6513340.1 4-oxalocrotonate tautomerase family protein [Helicobacter pylori]KAA8892224.1 4-oxalocrotonate tautomerase family protein [Helicobacter pylori]MBH0269876.1 4-oxalocrotonate tautomerase family protein [Helicobacter pylori]
MPFINIKLVPENGGPTNEQKQQLIEGVSDLMVKVLNKNKASVVVIIDEVDSNNYGLGGESVHHLRQKTKSSF